jgi:Peptidase propeptide and YPEB domain
MMKKTGAFFAGLLVFGLVFAGPAEAGRMRFERSCNRVQLAQYAGENDGYSSSDGQYAVSPSQAASIAKQTWPGAKVLRVQLLPSGVYAVTLKQGGEVSRVLVDATTGELS